MTTKHGGTSGEGMNGGMETARNSGPANMTNAYPASAMNKYNSVDARYHSIKNLPPDLRMKLRETLRQKMESKGGHNSNNGINSVEMHQPSPPTYNPPSYSQSIAMNGFGKSLQASENTNSYKTPPFNPAAYYSVSFSSL